LDHIDIQSAVLRYPKNPID